MKKIFIFSLFFVILISSPNQKAKDMLSSNHRYYVYPKSGLNLRSQPSIGSKSIGLLSRGAEIKVLEKTNQAFSADGISSNWWKVEVKGKTGYLFAGYVSRYPPPKKACSSIVDYLAEFYGEFNNKNPNITNYKKTARPCEGVEEMNYDDCETEETFKIKASGIQIYHKAGYEWGEEEVFFPNMQEIEGYLLLRECCHQENRLITYSEYKNMLENGVPIPEFQDTLYLSCRVKKKAGGISLGISFAL